MTSVTTPSSLLLWSPRSASLSAFCTSKRCFQIDPKFFRIPFLLATENNTLIAGTDVNFGSTGDSAENIDCAIRVKTSASTKSAYEGWSDAQIPSALHMQDYTDAVGYRQQSASFIDGVIVEDGELSNRILLVIDAWPWNGGLFSYLNVNAEGQASGGTMRTLPYPSIQKQLWQAASQ